jgi:hypothetical protein
LSDIEFELEPVEKKSRRRYRKGSKYDPIIDSFLNGQHNLVKVEAAGKDANYLRLQLKKRIDAKDLSNKIEVSVINNMTYLEKK